MKADWPYWLQKPCPTWCDQFHEPHDPDRRHISTDHIREVLLSTEDAVGPGQPAELVVYLDQHVREVGPRVILDQLPASRGRVHLLPAEARRLGQALLETAALAET